MDEPKPIDYQIINIIFQSHIFFAVDKLGYIKYLTYIIDVASIRCSVETAYILVIIYLIYIDVSRLYLGADEAYTEYIR